MKNAAIAAPQKRPVQLSARIRALTSDRVSVALIAVFALGGAFYLWRATYATPLSLYGGQNTPYNQLADAFLHLHLWVVNVPLEALGPGNPYNPAQRSAFLMGYPDYALYGHHLYITWGAAPVVVLLVPLHLLGFEPSASAISTPFAIVGLGFALATLRAIVRQIGEARLWMCILAGLTLVCASVMPYVERFPLVYHEEIAGGYCFAMAGIWCGAGAVANGRASFKRLALMSLCIGLATATRPTFAVTAVLLLVVYVSLRAKSRPGEAPKVLGERLPRRRLLIALATPFCVCALALAAYNYLRFDDPLQYGAVYQINGISTYTAHFGELGFLGPGLWAYLFAPPRLGVIFPFLLIMYPQTSYPLGLPAHYIALSEETGGLVPMVPIALFLAALPWLWRRRPVALGALAPLLVAMALAGCVCVALLSYEIYTATERYEADYMTLLLFGALAAWLALSHEARGRRRWLVRTGGGVLATWSCVTGLAMSLQEIEQYAGTWRTLVDAGAPLSTAIAAVAGHPIIAEVYASEIQRVPPNYSNLGTEVTGFSLSAGERADITIVSPNGRPDALVANTLAGPALRAGTLPEIAISGPGAATHSYRLAGNGAQARFPVHLNRGVNQLVLSVVGATASQTTTAGAEAQALVAFSNFTLASG